MYRYNNLCMHANARASIFTFIFKHKHKIYFPHNNYVLAGNHDFNNFNVWGTLQLGRRRDTQTYVNDYWVETGKKKKKKDLLGTRKK